MDCRCRRLALEHDGQDDDHALEDRLVLRLDVAQAEDVVENAQRQGADHRPDDGADAAGEARAADDDGGDGVELVAVAVDVAALVDQRRVQQRRQPGEQPGDQEDDEPDPVDVDAGEASRRVVAADGVDVAAEAGAPQHERGDQPDAEEVEDGRRDLEPEDRLSSPAKIDLKLGGARPSPSPNASGMA